MHQAFSGGTRMLLSRSNPRIRRLFIAALWRKIYEREDCRLGLLALRFEKQE